MRIGYQPRDWYDCCELAYRWLLAKVFEFYLHPGDEVRLRNLLNQRAKGGAS